MTDEENKENVKKNIKCKYFALNKCKKNEKCEFLHDYDKVSKNAKTSISQYQAYLNYTNTDCWMFKYGKCSSACTLKHELNSEEELEDIIPLPEWYIEMYFNMKMENILINCENGFLKEETRSIVKKIFDFELPVLNLLKLQDIKSSIYQNMNKQINNDLIPKDINDNAINSNCSQNQDMNTNNDFFPITPNVNLLNVNSCINKSVNINQSDIFMPINLRNNIPNSEAKRDSFTYQINNNIGNINYISNIKIFNNYIEDNRNLKVNCNQNDSSYLDRNNNGKLQDSNQNSKLSSFISKKSGKDLKSLLKPKIQKQEICENNSNLSNKVEDDFNINNKNIELCLKDDGINSNVEIKESNFVKRCLSEEGLKNLVNIRIQQSSSNSILSIDKCSFLGYKHSSQKNLNECFNTIVKDNDDKDDIDSSCLD